MIKFKVELKLKLEGVLNLNSDICSGEVKSWSYSSTALFSAKLKMGVSPAWAELDPMETRIF